MTPPIGRQSSAESTTTSYATKVWSLYAASDLIHSHVNDGGPIIIAIQDAVVALKVQAGQVRRRVVAAENGHMAHAVALPKPDDAYGQIEPPVEGETMPVEAFVLPTSILREIEVLALS